MDLEVDGTEVNLQELRDQLLRRTVALVTGAGAGLAILSLPGTDFHPDRFLGLCGVTVVGLCAYGLSKRWPTLARHFLVWGLTVSLVIAMWWFGEPWMPLLGLLLPFLSAVIVSGGEFATASGVFAASVAFTLLGHRQYPLGALAAVLAIAAATAWLLPYCLSSGTHVDSDSRLPSSTPSVSAVSFVREAAPTGYPNLRASAARLRETGWRAASGAMPYVEPITC